MLETAIHERLRQTRLARGQDLTAIAARTGVRRGVLEALEQGRYADLPRGIYGRSAVKAYAAAVGLDVDEILRACDAFLPDVEDPMAGIARVHGYAVPEPEPERSPNPRSVGSPFGDGRKIRLLAASAVDTAIILATLLGIVWVTIAAFGIPVAALGPGARPAFGLLGAVLAGSYFGVFGGIGGQTPGAWAASLEPAAAPRRIDLSGVVERAVRIAAHELLFMDLIAATRRR